MNPTNGLLAELLSCLEEVNLEYERLLGFVQQQHCELCLGVAVVSLVGGVFDLRHYDHLCDMGRRQIELIMDRERRFPPLLDAIEAAGASVQARRRIAELRVATLRLINQIDQLHAAAWPMQERLTAVSKA